MRFCTILVWTKKATYIEFRSETAKKEEDYLRRKRY